MPNVAIERPCEQGRSPIAKVRLEWLVMRHLVEQRLIVLFRPEAVGNGVQSLHTVGRSFR